MKRSVILTVFSLLVLAQLAWAQVPQTISYQGVLKDIDGNLLDGNYDLTFKLYDADENELWSEGMKLEPVSQGVFSVVLGNDPVAGPLPDPFPSPAWLGISVAGGAELEPRIELTAVPFALQAGELNMPATERWYALPAPEFRASGVGGSSYFPVDSIIYVYSAASGSNVVFFAPVHLPHGATITGFEIVVEDTAAGNMTVEFLSVSFGSDAVSTFATQSSFTSGGQTLDFGTLSTVVDNLNNAYLVRAAWNVPQSGPPFYQQDVNIRGARVKYTVDQPLP